MRMVKMVLVAGILVVSASATTVAVPLDITFIGSAPSHIWYVDPLYDPGFQDRIATENFAQAVAINLAGVNSITVTWSAPAGYMYEVKPPPPGLAGNSAELVFEAGYGSAGQASSLGSVTASSFSVQTVYGTSPLTAGISVNPSGPVLDFNAGAIIYPSTPPFAFTSISASADFSGTGTSQTLDRLGNGALGIHFGIMWGGFVYLGPNSYVAPPDPGPLITLEPLPTGSTPDASPTLSLAGLGIAGLFLFGLKRFCTLEV